MRKRIKWIAVCTMGVLSAAIISCLVLWDGQGEHPPRESTPPGLAAPSSKPSPPATTEPTVHICEFIYCSTQQPTCTAEGKKVFACVCGLQQEEAIPKIDHTYVYDHTVEATCTAEGKTVYTCACGDEQTETIPMLVYIY